MNKRNRLRDAAADRATRLFRRRMDTSKLTPEKLKEVQDRMRYVASHPIKIDSTLSVPEGLRITCATGDDARRLYEFCLLMTPEITHTLYEIHDRVLILKNVPEYPAVLPERGQFDSA